MKSLVFATCVRKKIIVVHDQVNCSNSKWPMARIFTKLFIFRLYVQNFLYFRMNKSKLLFSQ